ncbi:MAG: DUF4347 domain-containing protein, partial [Candidatus Thiodiazotropha sp.]
MRRRRPKKRSNALVCEELEPRLLLSADLVGIAVDLAPNDAEPEVEKADVQAIEAALQVGSPSQVGEHDSPTVELVIIDPATPDYQSLVDDLISQNGNGRSFEIVLLDTAGNGIEQISDILSAYQDLDAVHILSHGSDGGIQLGDAYLNLDSLSANAGAIESWRDAFSEEGDLLIYGCDLAAGEDGRSLVEALARLTGADVAASDDITGHETLGGDWDLEHAEGVIETEVAVSEEGQRNWSGILATDIDFTHTDDPVHHWTLDGDALDSVGSADGTVTGATTVTGQDGDALRFDEVDDYVTIPDVTMNNDFTVTFQFKVDDNTGSLFQYLYSHGDVNTENSLNIYINESSQGTAPNALRTVIRDTDDTLDYFALDFDISSIVGDGEWHTYTLTVQSGVGSTVYLDGVQKNTDTRGGDSINPSGNVYLGAPQDLDPDRMFGGDLDDVKIYDHVHPPTGVGTGLSAGTVIATDPVGGTVTYSLVDDAGGMFSIDSDSGELFWAGAPDTSTAQSYDITVRATDSGAPTYDEVMTIKTGTGDSDTITGTSHDDLIYGLGEGGSSLGTTNYITNGSFESGGSPSSAGWTLLSGPGFQIKTSGENGVLSSDGAYYLDTDESPGNISFEQTVTGLTDGQQYRLSFEAADFGFGFDNSLSIYFGGQLIGAIDPETSAMSTYSYSVTAGSGDGSDELRFVETGTEDSGGTAIDNIRMYEIIDGGDTLTGGAGDDILIGDGIGGSGTTSQPITINDAGFENTALPDGGTGPLSAAWTDDFGYNEVFIGDPSVLEFSSGAPAEGENALLMVEDNRVSQTLASNFDSSKDYELSLQLGNSLSSGNGNTYSVELYAGGTLIGSATGTEPAADTWTGINISVDGDAYAAADGTALRIVLENTSSYIYGDYFAVDDIQLNEITSVVAAGDDTLTGGAGDDYLDGGAGTDTAVFSGARADYTIDYYAATGELVVSDTRGGSPDGADTLINIETLQFSDQAVLITDPSAQFNDAPVGSPVITGIVTEDQTLTADTSGISDADGLGAFSFQWLRDGVAIAGATASTYTLGDADVGAQISVEVSYTDGQGTSEGPLTSAQTAAVAGSNDAPTFEVGDAIAATAIGNNDVDIRDSLIQPDGKIVTVGSISNATDDLLVARYNPDGTLDATFGGGDGIAVIDYAGFHDYGHSVILQDDGKLLISGTTTEEGNNFLLIRLNADGSLDSGFGGGDGIVATDILGSIDNSAAVMIQPDGKILVGGRAFDGVDYLFALVRYNSDGSLDSGFGGGDGIVTTSLDGVSHGMIKTISLQGDGKIVVGGDWDNQLTVARYNSDGSLDTSFSGNGWVSTDFTGSLEFGYETAIQPDGKILLSGYSYDLGFLLVRYNSDGTLDTSFGGGDGKLSTLVGTSSTAVDMALLADGKIMVAGYSSSGDTDITVVRYNSDGTLDSSFGGGDGIVTTDIYGYTDVARSISVQSDGKFILAGYTWDGAKNVMVVVRYNADGTLDTSFDPVNTLDGAPTFIEGGAAVVLDADVQVFDAELSAADNFDGATLTLERTGAADADDVYSATGTLSPLTEGGSLIVGGTTIGAVTTNSGGTLVLSFNTNATNALVNSAMQQIAYSNDSDTPPASVQIDWTFDDGNTGAQGSGGALQATGSTTVGITADNYAPTDIIVPDSLQLNMDGRTDDYASVDGFTDFPSTALTYEISFASNTDGLDETTLVSYAVPGEDNEFELYIETGFLWVYIGGATTGDTISNDGLFDGERHQLSVSWENTTGELKVYVDGVLQHTETSFRDGVTLEGGGTFLLGQEQDSVGGGFQAYQRFEGDIYDVRIYDDVRTDQEIADNANTLLADPSADPNLVANWQMTDNGSGGIADLAGDNDLALFADAAFGPITVREDVADGTSVGFLSTIDPDAGDTHTYSLLDDAGGAFSIDTNTGLVSVADGSLIDYETASSMDITVRTTDGGGLSYDEVITITIENVDEYTPVANADSVSVAEGGTATLLDGGFATVLNNDTGLGDTPVTVSLVTDVTNGSLTLNGDGTFSYTHDGSENFTDSFTYRITDNDGETADATVTINVTPVSDETPVANADSISVAEGGTATLLDGGFATVLNNDTGLGDTPVT